MRIRSLGTFALLSMLFFCLPDVAVAEEAGVKNAPDGAGPDESVEATPQAMEAPSRGSIGPAPAADPRAFMDRVFRRSEWRDMKAQVGLTLRNRRGDERVRRIDLWSRQDDDGNSRMLMRFIEPADVRGTAFLLIEHENTADDRRLWMPALRRVQRIAASGVGGSFMSSDFTYYDIGRPDLTDWEYSYQGTGSVGDSSCEIILGTAANERVQRDTGHASIRWCVDPERLVILEADYTDRHGAPLKKLRILEIRDVAGTPFATHMRMENVETGHSSEMIFADLEIDTGIEDEIFTERSLRRGR